MLCYLCLNSCVSPRLYTSRIMFSVDSAFTAEKQQTDV